MWSPNETVGAISSSVIVIVAVPEDVLTSAFVGEVRATANVSFSSSIVSARIVISTVLLVSPGLKVNVPPAAV